MNTTASGRPPRPRRPAVTTRPARHARQRPVPLRLGMLAALIASGFGAADAAPALPHVVSGQASFSQDGNVFSIRNAPNTIINWQSFSIGAGEVTRFVQDSTASSVLNRITGQDPSVILGALQSNGKVFLVNPNGVLFGANARVDVNGLVASSLNISNQDFLAGKMNFDGSTQAGKVANGGTIDAAGGGQVLLIAPNVENTGLINAPNGDVMLAAGHSVQLADAANPALRVVVSAGAAEALNVGRLVARGGGIGMAGALVSQRGLLDADGAERGAGGTILLRASARTSLEAGSVTSAASTGGRGGAVTVLGDQVGLSGDARVDASGALGGGTVLLGGDTRGRNPVVPNARQVAVGSGVTIAADALDSGDGGKVVVWGDDSARVAGSISARGGRLAGNGGSVETSGHYLAVDGVRVDTRAAQGRSGTWLLDPYDIDVVANSAGDPASAADFDAPPTDGTTSIGAGLISNATSNVVLQATHRITFSTPIYITAPGVGLSAAAGESIDVNGSIRTNGGALSLSANDAASGHAYGDGANLTVAASLNTGAGSISLSGSNVHLYTDVTAGDLRVAAALTVDVYGAIAVGGAFRLDSGSWIQNSAVLPAFSSGDFYLAPGTSFLRTSGGDGASAPYRIDDVYGLQGIGHVSPGLAFVLTGDIDASTATRWNGGAVFAPLSGRDGDVFTGTLDGGGFAIRNLRIHGGGLFAGLGDGTVRNLTLADGSVQGAGYAGALVGFNGGAVIDNVHSNLTVVGNDIVGGLVGRNGGTIVNSSASGAVQGGISAGVGGLAGVNDGTIGQSYASGAVNGSGNGVGGLVGINSGHISASYATGTVYGLGDAVGGLVGGNGIGDGGGSGAGSIDHAYASGNVGGGASVGGLVGINGGTVAAAYATGAVGRAPGASGAGENLGGLIGYNGPGGAVSQVYSTGPVVASSFDPDTVGGLIGNTAVGASLAAGYWNVVSAGIGTDCGGATGLTPAQMQQQASFAGFDFGAAPTWRIYEGATTPLLKALLTPLTVTVNAPASQVYDGEVARFTGSLAYDGLLAGDSGVAGSAGYGNARNVGTYALQGLYSTRYDIALAGATALSITPRTLGVQVGGGKVYDGTTSLPGTNVTLSNVVGGDALAIGSVGSVQFADKNVGTAKAVNVSGMTLVGDTLGNYVLPASVTGTAAITPATLTLGGVGAANKIYDGTTSATVNATLSGVVAGDVVTLSGATAHFADKNAGIAKAVAYSVGSTSLGGADAANYRIDATGSTTADIAARALDISYSAQNKAYDGTTTAAVTATLSGVLGSDQVRASGASGSFADKNAGCAKRVDYNVGSITLQGADAANYRVGASGTAAGARADITARDLNLTYRATDKVYDGTTAATIAFSDDRVAGDALTLVATASFADKNVGTKAIALSPVGVQGADAGNYRLLVPTIKLQATITPAPLTLAQVTAKDKVYDGNVAASVGAVLGGVLGQDDVTVVGGTGSFADANRGAGKTVVASGFALGGADAGNYTLANNGGSALASIAQRPLSTWIGGAGNLWSDAANWEGGAVPSADNVLAVSIAGANVEYTAAAGNTVVKSLTANGALAVSGGSLTLGLAPADVSSVGSLALNGGGLQLGGTLVANAYTQTGALVSGAGSLTVNGSFSQSAGAVQLGGDVALAQLAGDLRVGSIAANALTLTAANGAIGQSAAIAAASLNTRSQSGTVLDNAGNRVAGFGATNSGAGGIALTNSTTPNTLVLGKLATGGGDIVIDNTGGIESHAIDAGGGNVKLVAHSPVNVLGAIRGNDVAIQASTTVAVADGASVTALHDIAVSAGSGLTLGGKATLAAGNGLSLDAATDLLMQGSAALSVLATGSMRLASARGSIGATDGVRIDSHGAPVTLSAPQGSVAVPAAVFVGTTLGAAAQDGVPALAPTVQDPVASYAAALTQQYNPIDLVTSTAVRPTAFATANTATANEKNGKGNAKKLYCN